MIKISGLNKSQKDLADVMYTINSSHDYEAWYNTLSGSDQSAAVLIEAAMAMSLRTESEVSFSDVCTLIQDTYSTFI